MDQEQDLKDTSLVDVLLRATQKHLGQIKEEIDFPLPGKGAKADVLLHSIGVFTSKGIDETTVQDLLEAAGISRRTFYKYFKNKVDVLESIYQMAAELLFLRFKAVQTQSANASELVVQCVGLYFDYHTHMGPLVRMMTEEARRTDSPLAVHRNQLLENIVNLFNEKYYELENVQLNPKVYYGLIWMIESASMDLLTQVPCDQQVVDEYKEAMCAIGARVLVTDPGQWSDVPKLPVKLSPITTQ